MNRAMRASGLASAVVMTALTTKTFAAEEAVLLPCPVFKTGNSWKYVKKASVGPVITNTVVVLANDGKKILLADRAILDGAVAGMPGGNTLQEIEYENTGSVIVRNSIKVGGMQISVEPPEPVCGNLPTQWKTTSKIILFGSPKFTQSTTTVRALGKEKITVPAGTFDATVVEFSRQDTPSATSPPGTVGVRHVDVIHAVENVGVVRVMSTTTSTVTQSAATPNPQAQALIQEGIRKMQKGEDASEVMRQLSALPADNGGPQKLDSTERRSESVTALQTFEINH